jgi:hypothetical protein
VRRAEVSRRLDSCSKADRTARANASASGSEDGVVRIGVAQHSTRIGHHARMSVLVTADS